MSTQRGKAGKWMFFIFFIFGFYLCAHTILLAQSPSDTTLANEYFTKAEKFASEAKYDSSNTYFKKASEIYEELGDWEKYVKCYNNIGDNLWNTDRFDNALEYLNKALEIGKVKLGGKHFEVSTSYLRLGNVHSVLNKYDKAIEYYNKSLMIRLELLGDNHPDVAKNYFNIGNVYLGKGYFDEALDYYQKSFAGFSQLYDENHFFFGYYYNNMGNFYYDKGDYDNAMIHYEKSLDVFDKIYHDNPDSNPFIGIKIADVYTNIGLIYHFRGDYDEAMQYQKQSLNMNLKLRGEHHSALASNYNNIGLAYSSKGNYDSAIKNYKNALEINVQTLGKENSEIVLNYMNIGVSYKNSGDYESAIANYNKALEIGSRVFGEMHSELAPIHINIGNVHRIKRNADEAVKAFNKGIEIRLQLSNANHPDVAAAYQGLGELYFEQHDFQKTLQYSQKAIITLVPNFADTNIYRNPDLDKISSEPYLLSSLALKAEVLEKLYTLNSQSMADIQNSLETYRIATELIDTMRISYKAEGSKLLLGESAYAIYGKAIQTAWKLYGITRDESYKNDAFSFAEKGKYGVLLEAISHSKAKRFSRIPNRLLDRERKLKIDLSFYDTQLQREYEKNEGADSLKIRDFEGRYFTLNAQYRELIRDLETQYPAYYDLKYRTQTASTLGIQKILDDETALIEYFIGDSAVFIFTITKTEFEMTSVKIDSSLLNHHINQVRAEISRNDFMNNADQSYRRYTENAFKLYTILVEPIKGIIENKDLIIVPDGKLAHIPFEALITEQPDTSVLNYHANTLKYMINKHQIRYGYSANFFLENLSGNRYRNFSTNYIGFAPLTSNPLNYSREEVEKAKNVLGGSTYDSNATVQRFKSEAPKADILHLATHAHIDDKNSLLSNFEFSASGDSVEDNYLHMYEIYNLELNAQLTILSGCNTGSGELIRGEGIMSLARGVTYAGCPSTVMSLWQVDDKATSVIMEYFSEGVRDGLPKGEALYQAKRTYMQGVDHIKQHPYFWAGLIIIGDTGTIRTNAFLFYALIVILAVTAILSFIYRQHRKRKKHSF